jgi:hypothetical protein
MFFYLDTTRRNNSYGLNGIALDTSSEVPAEVQALFTVP